MSDKKMTSERKPIEIFALDGQDVFPLSGPGGVTRAAAMFPSYRDGQDLILYGYHIADGREVARGGFAYLRAREEAIDAFEAVLQRRAQPTTRDDPDMTPMNGEIVRWKGYFGASGEAH